MLLFTNKCILKGGITLPTAIEALLKAVIVATLCAITFGIANWLSVEQRVIPMIVLVIIIFTTLMLFDKKVKPKLIAAIYTKKP